MITVIIPTLNDPNLENTLISLRNQCKVIVVNDGGTPVQLKSSLIDQTQITIVNLPQRIGPARARQAGAEIADGGWLMFTDSHMIFPEDWYQVACRHLAASQPNRIWGTIYHSDCVFNSFWHDTKLIGGADFYLWRHHNLKYSFADITPRRIQRKPQWDVPVLLGACYFVHWSWFETIGGFKQLIGYGSEEAWMSMSTWLRGGRVSLMGNLTVTHLYQKTTTRARPVVPEWEFNRLMVLRRILTDHEYANFCSWLPIASPTKDWVDQHISSAFTELRIHDRNNYDDIASEFGLQTFQESLDLMQEYDIAMNDRCGVCKNRRWLIDPSGSLKCCQLCNRDGAVKPSSDRFELREAL